MQRTCRLLPPPVTRREGSWGSQQPHNSSPRSFGDPLPASCQVASRVVVSQA